MEWQWISQSIIGCISIGILYRLLDYNQPIDTSQARQSFLRYAKYLVVARVLLDPMRNDTFTLMQAMKVDLLIVFLFYIAVVDFRTKQIKNITLKYMLRAYGVITGVELFLYPQQAWLGMKWGAVGFLFAGGLFLIAYILSKGAIGGGDVKLIAVMGLYLGYEWILGTLLYSLIASALVGGMLVVCKKRDKQDTIPFAPFLLVGTIGTLLWGI